MTAVRDDRWKRDGLFFFHNPKAAGVSLRFRIREYFAREAVCPTVEKDVPDHEKHRHAFAQFSGFKMYWGHYGRDFFDAVRERHVPMTCFRHPAERVFSLYNFFRANPLHPELFVLPHVFAVATAKTKDFKTFALSDDPRIRVYTHNFHARQLTWSPWEVDRPGDLGQAQALLDAMPWFFVLEREALSIAWAQAAIGLDLTALSRENRSPIPREEWEARRRDFDDVRGAIEAYNDLDMELYLGAVKRIEAEAA